MPQTSIDQLPRREREVFETLYRLEQATTATLRGVLADPLSNSAVRTLLSRLEAKGLVRRTAGPDGFLYAPVPRTDAVAEGALKRMVETFFAGSAASAARMASLSPVDSRNSPSSSPGLTAGSSTGSPATGLMTGLALATISPAIWMAACRSSAMFPAPNRRRTTAIRTKWA